MTEFFDRQWAAAHLDKLLDEALEQTFRASDPVAIDFEQSVSSLRDVAVEASRTDQRKQQSLQTSGGAGQKFISNTRHITATR